MGFYLVHNSLDKSRSKRIKENYEDELKTFCKQLPVLKSELEKIQGDNSIPTYQKNKQIRSIQWKIKSLQQKIDRTEKQTKLPHPNLQKPKKAKSKPWDLGYYTICYSCGTSINKKESSKCPRCKGSRCPKCCACLCSYNGDKGHTQL